MAFDKSNPTHLAQLKSEVTTDPNAYGYVPENTDTGVLDIINLKRATITVSKPKISAATVRSTCTYDAFEGLLGPEELWLTWMTGSNGFDEENVVVTDDLRQKLAGDPTANDAIWAAADRNAMNAAMLDLIDVDGSRAEELWGFATSISRDDWIAARDS